MRAFIPYARARPNNAFKLTVAFGARSLSPRR